jgi:hypothetical protein
MTTRTTRCASRTVGHGRARFPLCYGTELTSNAILARSKDHKVEWRYFAPGKPMQNDACATNCSTRAC